MRKLAVLLLLALGAALPTLPVFPALAAPAAPTEWTLPSYAIEVKTPEIENAKIALSVSEVDAADESAFIEWMITERRSQVSAGAKLETLAPITMIVRENDQRLSGRATELARLKIFVVSVPDAIAKLARNDDETSNRKITRHRSKRAVAAEWSLDGVKSAGTYVALGCGTAYSAIFFATQDAGAAALGTVLTFTLQMIGNKYAQQQLRFFNAGGDVALKLVEKLKTLPPKGQAAVHEIGRWVNGYLYNYAASAAFTIALSPKTVAVQMADFTTLAQTVAITAATGMFSDNSWDMGFANQMKEAEAKGDLKKVKTLILMKYTKSVVMTAISPFMFLESTRPYAITVLAGAGVLGIGARKYPQPFVNAAEKGIALLEQSPFLNGLVDRLARKRLPTPVISCRKLLSGT